MKSTEKFRCDHCRKWVAEGDCTLGTLEGIVSPGININFSICERCFEKRGCDLNYWDSWVKKTNFEK